MSADEILDVQMDREAYKEHIRIAHRDEQLGYKISEIVCEKFGQTWSDYDHFRLLGELEQQTGKVLEPIMARHHLPIMSDAEVGVIANEMSASVGSLDELLSMLRGMLPPVVELFDQLVLHADAEDKEAMSLLAAHERALLDLSIAETAEQRSVAFQEISKIIEIEKAHNSALN